MARLYRPDCVTYQRHLTLTLLLLTRASSHAAEAWHTASDSIDELKSRSNKANSKRLAIAVLACCSIRTFVEHLAAHQAAPRASRFESAPLLLDLSSLSYKLSEKYRVYNSIYFRARACLEGKELQQPWYHVNYIDLVQRRVAW